MPSLSQPIGSITYNPPSGTISNPGGGISDLLYADVLDSDSNIFIVSNRVLNSSGTAFLVNANVLDKDGNAFIIFT